MKSNGAHDDNDSSSLRNGDVDSISSHSNVVVDDEADALVDEVMSATGIADRSHAKTLLVDHNFDVSAVIQFYTLTELAEEEEEEEGDGVEKGSKEDEKEDEKGAAKAITTTAPPSARPRMSRPEMARSKVKSTKEKRKEKRGEKKARQAERNRRKLVGDEETVEADDVHVLTQEIKCLDL